MKLPSALIALASLASASTVLAQQQQSASMPICSAWPGEEYEKAKLDYPHLKDKIETVQGKGTAPWYTDNKNTTVLNSILTTLSTKCPANTKIPMVVYGIPNKDCKDSFSNTGFNKNFDDYKTFIGKLTSTFPTQNMLYIVEPDAVGLTADGGCGIQSEYPMYLKYVLGELSKNPNAELYLDIGFWLLMKVGGNPEAMAEVVNEVWPSNGSLKGIAINTSNYRNTTEMIELCDSFANVTGRQEMKCIIDTSRNLRGPTSQREWCNAKGRGIGVPPTMDTGNPRAAYYLWIKPPGESDGECVNRTSDAMPGPKAGVFFKDHFVQLWNNGYFVENGAEPIVEVPDFVQRISPV